MAERERDWKLPRLHELEYGTHGDLVLDQSEMGRKLLTLARSRGFWTG